MKMYIELVECFLIARGSLSGRVIPKTQKMVLDAALFNNAL